MAQLQLKKGTFDKDNTRSYSFTGLPAAYLGGHQDFQIGYNKLHKPFNNMRPLSEAKQESPLMAQLLEAGALSVLIKHYTAKNVQTTTITVNKSPKQEWSDLSIDPETAIKGQINARKAIFSAAFKPPVTEAQRHAQILNHVENSDDSHVRETFNAVSMILKAIENLNVQAATHSGDVRFHSYDADEGLVYVELTGNCNGCTSKSSTLKPMEKALTEVFAAQKISDKGVRFVDIAPALSNEPVHATICNHPPGFHH